MKANQGRSTDPENRAHTIKRQKITRGGGAEKREGDSERNLKMGLNREQGKEQLNLDRSKKKKPRARRKS